MGRNRRTDVDFSKHELIIINNADYKMHYLKLPDTITRSVKFINTQGIMAVTGDYGNWIFCREFIPDRSGKTSERYWIEKLKISSCQDPYKFNTEAARKEILESLKSFSDSYSHEERVWLKELYQAADDGEYTFIAKAMDHPNSFDCECIPTGKEVDWYLLVIMDAFDEICDRLKDVV